jgi:hypothetical protein
MQAIDSVYNSDAEAEAYVIEFAKQFLPRASNRMLVYEMKRKLHSSAIKVM